MDALDSEGKGTQESVLATFHYSWCPGRGHCCKAPWSPPLCLPLGKLIKARLVTGEYDIFDLVVEMKIKNM